MEEEGAEGLEGADVVERSAEGIELSAKGGPAEPALKDDGGGPLVRRGVGVETESAEEAGLTVGGAGNAGHGSLSKKNFAGVAADDAT